MCKVTTPYKKSTTFTGYKCVIEYFGKIYSPVTGLEYKVGPVPIIKKRRKHAHPVFVNVLDPKEKAYEPKMKGKTGVFTRLELAINHYGSTTNEIVKMTISGDLHNGIISFSPIVVGNHIDSISEIN